MFTFGICRIAFLTRSRTASRRFVIRRENCWILLINNLDESRNLPETLVVSASAAVPNA
jgi:hypothetical protein